MMVLGEKTGKKTDMNTTELIYEEGIAHVELMGQLVLKRN